MNWAASAFHDIVRLRAPNFKYFCTTSCARPVLAMCLGGPVLGTASPGQSRPGLEEEAYAVLERSVT